MGPGLALDQLGEDVLAPDVNATESQLQQQVSAAQAVTQYCQAVTTLVPAYAAAVTDPSLQKMLQTVQTDTQTWPNSLCAAFTQQVPGNIIAFNTTFSASSASLTQDSQTLLSNPDDQKARGDLIAQLQNLLNGLQQTDQQITNLAGQLVTFENTVQSDHALIDGGLQQLSQEVPHGATIIQSVQANLGVSFFSSQQLSPCIAIVEIDSDVSLKVTETAASAPEVIPFVLAQALLTSLKTTNEQATAALSAILNTWQSLTTRYQAVITDITQAESSQLGGIVQQLEIQTTIAAWNELAEFASQLIGNE
ncbi:MAG TPA: hypothetical protein VNE17_01365 [Nitrolancea sp.]|nr:hypothetical protein [Nitrolancea sp.]